MVRTLLLSLALCSVAISASAQEWFDLDRYCRERGGGGWDGEALRTMPQGLRNGVGCRASSELFEPFVAPMLCPGVIELDGGGRRARCGPIDAYALALGEISLEYDSICGTLWSSWIGDEPRPSPSGYDLKCRALRGSYYVDFVLSVTCPGELTTGVGRRFICSGGGDDGAIAEDRAPVCAMGASFWEDSGPSGSLWDGGFAPPVVEPPGGYADEETSYRPGMLDSLDWLEAVDQDGEPDDPAADVASEDVGPVRFCLLSPEGDRPASEASYSDRFYLEFDIDRDGAAIEARLRDDAGRREDLELIADLEYPTLYRTNVIEASDYRAEGQNTVYGAGLGLLATLALSDGAASPPAEPLSVSLTAPDQGLEALLVQRVSLTIEGGEPDEIPPLYELFLEGRHAADPDGEFTREALEMIAATDETGCELLSEADALPHRFICRRDGEAAPFIEIVTPEVAFLSWRVRGLSDDIAPVDEQEWRGMLDIAPGRLPELAIDKPDETPQILNVFPVHPQTGLDSFGDAVTHFPAPGGRAAARYLLVLGRDLPQRATETELRTEDGLRYYFYSSPESLSPQELPYSFMADGVQRMLGAGADPVAAIAKMREAGIDVMVVEADLPPGALPGARSFTLNDAPIDWLLEYADARLELEFIRRRAADPAEGQDALREVVRESYGDETVYLEASVSPPSLPLDAIQIELELYDGETGEVSHRPLTLTPVTPGDYRSGPLILDPGGAGAEAITLSAGDGDYSAIRARVAPELAASRMPFAAKAGAELLIDRAPDRSPWEAAVATAARCSGVPTSDRSISEAAFADVSEEIGEELGNTFVLKGFETIAQNARVGHHAGLLFLRRHFLFLAGQEEDRLAAMLSDRASLVAQYLAWRRDFELLLVENPRSPLFKIRVDAQPLAKTMTLGDIVRYAPQYAKELKAKGVGDAQILAWVEGRMADAVGKMLAALRASNAELRKVDECDAPELLRFALGLTAVAQHAEPLLLRREAEGWAPDVAARRWVRSAVGVAETWDQQRRASEEDTDKAMLMASIVTFPLGFAETAAIRILGSAFEFADVAISVASKSDRYAASRAELARSMGMSAVIGDARYEKARKDKVSGLSVAADIGLAVMGAAFDGVGLMEDIMLRRADALRRSSKLADGLTDAQIDALADMRDALRRRAGASGLESLDPADQELLLRLDSLKPLQARRPGPRAPALEPGGSGAVKDQLLTPEQVAVLRKAGVDASGLPHIIPFTPVVPASVRPSARVADASDGAILDAFDSGLRGIINRTSPTSLKGILARQSLQMLRDPKLSIFLRPRYADVGGGLFLDEATDSYGIVLNYAKFAKEKWHPLAIFAHEAAHMAQGFLQKRLGITIGRSVREFDASMKMSVIQNALADIQDGVQRVTPQSALLFSLSYAADVQLGSFKLLGSRSPRFKEWIDFHDGLFQLDHVAVLARSKAMFPELGDREILDAFLQVHRARLANLDPDVVDHPVAAFNGFVDRYRDMVRNAEAARAAL